MTVSDPICVDDFPFVVLNASATAQNPNILP